jgi:hypothetical protein
MNKTLSSFAALILFGSFAATSGAFASTHDGAGFAENINGQTIERLEMSDEERERRKEVCDREYEFCYDWCSRSRRDRNEQRKCYEDCSDKNVECLDKLR